MNIIKKNTKLSIRKNIVQILEKIYKTNVFSTLSFVSRGIGILISSSSALITPIAILITNEYTSKLKRRYTKLGEWINVIILLYQKTLKQLMIDKNIEQEEADDIKNINNHFLTHRSDFMNKKLSLK